MGILKTFNSFILKFKHWRMVVIVFSTILFSMNFVRIFNNDFWMDETFSILTARLPVLEIIQKSMGEQSPPLYYLILKFGTVILGDHDWVYRLVSLIPLAIIMVIFLTYGWKRFGGMVSTLFISFVSLMYNGLHYHMEVRPYPWAALFTIVVFLSLFEILRFNSNWGYVILSVGTLATGFTHYFSLVSSTLLFLTLIIYSFIRRKYLKKTLITSGITLVIYLPWVYVFLSAYASDKGASWLEKYDSIQHCLQFLFDGKMTWIFLGTMLFMFVIMLIRAIKNHAFEAEQFWIVSGMFAVFGTIGVGVVASEISHPILLVRHIYPVTLIAWLLLSYLLRNVIPNIGRWITLIVMMLFLFTAIPVYRGVLESEAKCRSALANTISGIENELKSGDIIVSDLIETRYYFDDFKVMAIADGSVEDAIEFEKGKRYLLVIDTPDEDFENKMFQKGCVCTKLSEHQYIGTTYADVYILDLR